MTSVLPGCWSLLAGVDELNTVPLILERTREIESLPATVLTLILVRGWAYLRYDRNASGNDEESTGGHEGLGARHRVDTDDRLRIRVSYKDVTTSFDRKPIGANEESP